MLAQTRRGGQGTLSASRREVWRACRAAATLLDVAMEAGDAELVAKAIYTVIQSNEAFRRLVSETEIEEQLKRVQELLDDKKIPR
jgi:hypothetical protein